MVRAHSTTPVLLRPAAKPASFVLRAQAPAAWNNHALVAFLCAASLTGFSLGLATKGVVE